MTKRQVSFLLTLLCMLTISGVKAFAGNDDMNMKFSGYGMVQYQAQDQEEAKNNSFNLRLLRMILDGRIGDFDWRAQIQGSNVKGPGEPTVQLLDLYAEWVRYKECRIRVGQIHPRTCSSTSSMLASTTARSLSTTTTS